MEQHLSRDARNLRPSAIRAFAKLINDPNVISFAGGVPSPETFPAERVAAIAERVIRERRAVALQYGPTAGLPRLREGFKRAREVGYQQPMEPYRGVETSPGLSEKMAFLMSSGALSAIGMFDRRAFAASQAVLPSSPNRKVDPQMPPERLS